MNACPLSATAAISMATGDEASLKRKREDGEGTAMEPGVLPGQLEEEDLREASPKEKYKTVVTPTRFKERTSSWHQWRQSPTHSHRDNPGALGFMENVFGLIQDYVAKSEAGARATPPAPFEFHAWTPHQRCRSRAGSWVGGRAPLEHPMAERGSASRRHGVARPRMPAAGSRPVHCHAGRSPVVPLVAARMHALARACA